MARLSGAPAGTAYRHTSPHEAGHGSGGHAAFYTNRQQITSIPRRISQFAKDTWLLQDRLVTRRPRTINRLMNHQRFRAAYDLLMLRADAGESELFAPPHNGGPSTRNAITRANRACAKPWLPHLGASASDGGVNPRKTWRRKRTSHERSGPKSTSLRSSAKRSLAPIYRAT